MTTPDTGQLKIFFNALSTDGKKNFAERCHTTVGYITQVMYGNSNPSASLAIDIDRESGGLVPCESLCPGADFDYVKSKAVSDANVSISKGNNSVQEVAS